MGQYPELYLLVEPDKLLAGLSLMEDIELPGSDSWREELESGHSFMLATGRSWLSVAEFCALLPTRLKWLRSVGLPASRLDSNGCSTDGERALGFQLKQGCQFLHVITTNWMQLALPEHVRSECMMLSISFECASAKSKIWIPPDHPVMPMLFRFLAAVRPIYGRVATDDIDALNQYTVEEVHSGTTAWAGLWHGMSGCMFLNPALVQAIEERSDLLHSDGGLGSVVRLPGVGLWCTVPSDWSSDSFSEEQFQQHWNSIYRLADVLKTIPDSVIFPL